MTTFLCSYEGTTLEIQAKDKAKAMQVFVQAQDVPLSKWRLIRIEEKVAVTP